MNIEELLRAENAAWNSHDADRIVSFYTEDCIKEDVSVRVAARGREEIRAVISRGFAAVPDMRVDLKLVFHTDDYAGSEWTMSGTFSGSLSGMPPVVGKAFSVQGASIMELRDGKISRVADYWDSASLFRQVGLMSLSPQL